MNTMAKADYDRHVKTLKGSDDATACEDCGVSVAPEYADHHEGLCPKCLYRSQVDAARDEVVDAKEDLDSLREELADLMSRLAEGKERLAGAKAALKTLKG